MPESLYKIIFNGKIEKGIASAIVKKRLKGLCNKDMNFINRIFEDLPVTVRTNLTQSEAELYQSKFNESGAVCDIEKMSIEAAKNKAVKPSLKLQKHEPISDIDNKTIILDQSNTDFAANQVTHKKDLSLSPETSLIPSSITYELVELIGSGGMGEVYKAKLYTNTGTSETVVIKKIKKDMLKKMQDERKKTSILDNFKKETSILAELNGHPNIVGFRGAEAVKAMSGDIKEIFFVMEYVNGFDLIKLMAHHQITRSNLLKGCANKIPDQFFGFIIFRIANALDYAHNFEFSDGHKGIVHLDISPGNVLINAELGLIKLSDFGISHTMDELHKLQKIGSAKPMYASPEVLNQKNIDMGTDFYSLGVTLYQLVTGICPNKLYQYNPTSIRDYLAKTIALQKLELIPPNKIIRNLDEEISDIIMYLMEYHPENRIDSASTLREMVGQCIYAKGYGPTDSSFSQYLAKLQLHHYPNHEIKKFCKIFKSDLEPLRLHNDAKKKFEQGINPSRKY